MVPFRPHLAKAGDAAGRSRVLTRIREANDFCEAVPQVSKRAVSQVFNLRRVDKGRAMESFLRLASRKSATRQIRNRRYFRNAEHALPVLLLFLNLCVSISMRAGEANPLLESWLSAQTNLHTWSAEVTQTRTLKTLTQPLTAKGQVWFAAPNRFRWQIGNTTGTAL